MKQASHTLIKACKSNDLQLVEQILEKGYDVNYPANDMEIPIFSLVCGFKPMDIEGADMCNENYKKAYKKLLRSIWK